MRSQKTMLDRRAAVKSIIHLGVSIAASRLARGRPATDVVVETSLGKVRGKAMHGVQIFKGIRYGGSTAGANRFLPPQPVAPWSGVHDALNYGNSAPQPKIEARERAGFAEILTTSEDCLFLNVFTPTASAGARRPVMAWMHGGAWSVGAGTAPALDGSNLARLGDVVVVTINHRLNVFGYLKLDDADERFVDSANAGVLDIVAALKWIRDNATAFGGDPGNVTIFGQSGGGGKVSALMATPAAKGLFHKAIAQSCSGSLRLMEAEAASALTHRLGQGMNLRKLTGASLQAVPMDNLIAAARGGFRPVVDYRTFSRHPFDPDPSPLGADIPLMVGNVANETRIMLAAADINNFSLDLDEVRRRLARFLRIDAVETKRITEAYQSADPDGSPGDILGAVTTDFVYIRNTRHEANLKAAAGSTPVYSYLFTRRTPVLGGLLRCPHESEVAFVFGDPTAAWMVGGGTDLPALTKVMVATWSAFAHTGNPNNATLPRWPRHTPNERFSMLLNVSSMTERDPGGVARASLEHLPHYDYNMQSNYTQA